MAHESHLVQVSAPPLAHREAKCTAEITQIRVTQISSRSQVPRRDRPGRNRRCFGRWQRPGRGRGFGSHQQGTHKAVGDKQGNFGKALSGQKGCDPRGAGEERRAGDESRFPLCFSPSIMEGAEMAATDTGVCVLSLCPSVPWALLCHSSHTHTG